MFKSEKEFFTFDNPKLQSNESTSVQPSKVIDMSHVTNVCFHYDKDAPEKSKKLFNAGLDESRFDIYTPTRKFMMKAEANSI